MSQNRRRNSTELPFYRKSWVCCLVVLFVMGTASLRSAPPASTFGLMPPQEENFIQIVVAARNSSQTAENDMQRGGAKVERDRAICQVLPSVAVSDWVGTVDKVDSNSDGLGVLGIILAGGVRVETWNNLPSDLRDRTLIEPGSRLFNSASKLKPGQMIYFSGTFIRSQGRECIRESSTTLRDKIEAPAFVFRFVSISTKLPDGTPIPQPDTAATESKALNFVPPKVIHQVMPDVTALRDAGMTSPARVEVQVLVDVSGFVKEAKLLSYNGNDAVANAAITAAKQWIFQPATVGGKNVESNHKIVFKFVPELPKGKWVASATSHAYRLAPC